MNSRVIIVLLFAFLLIQCSLAKDAEKGTKKASKQKEAKATVPPADKEDAEFKFFEYSNKVYTASSQYAHQALSFLNEYTQPLANELHDYLAYAADQYLEPKHASAVKQWLNPYGIIAFSLFSFAIGFLIPNLTWIISVNVLQPSLTTFGLGVYGTLFALTQTAQDPAIQVAKASKTALDNWRYAELVYFGTLALVLFVALLRGKTSSFLALVLNSLLIADHLKFFPLKSAIPYLLQVTVFFVLAFISFGRTSPDIKKPNRNLKPEIQTRPQERENQEKEKQQKKQNKKNKKNNSN